jgi:hypothetical protein
MVLLLFGLLVLAAVYLWLHFRARSPVRRHGWKFLWRAACLIGMVRIGALWAGAAAFQSSGWAQVPGYFLQLIALPEIYLVRGLRDRPLKWVMAGSVLLAATSFLWAALLAWGADRIRPSGADNR